MKVTPSCCLTEILQSREQTLECGVEASSIVCQKEAQNATVSEKSDVHFLVGGSVVHTGKYWNVIREVAKP